jgi:putative oxidoreductase
VLPFLIAVEGAGILVLRPVIALIFFSSGWADVRDREGRSKGIGMSEEFTVFLGVAEIAVSLSVAVGILPQGAAMGLMLIMMGAIGKQMFVWRTGFWGKAGYEWHSI